MSELSEPTPPLKPPHSGGRNRLVIFGIAAVAIAIVTTSISLLIYIASGDIYLDRSRPGFISADEPPSESGETSDEAAFSSDGLVTKSALNEYTEKLDLLIRDITQNPNAFSSDALSDETLNITGSANDQPHDTITP